jgi:hypothetical protein
LDFEGVLGRTIILVVVGFVGINGTLNLLVRLEDALGDLLAHRIRAISSKSHTEYGCHFVELGEEHQN